MNEQENDYAKGKWLSVKQMIVILGVLALLAAGIWGYNSFRLKEITVEGLSRYTKEEFLNKLESDVLFALTPVYCMHDSLVQKSIPFVEKYEIEYMDSHTARIIVHEKRVTGCVVVMGRYMFFDKDGIVVETSDSRLEGIPVITGLKFDEIVLYKKLNVQKQSLFDTILELTRLTEQKGIVTNEISFDSNYEVTLYLDEITVLLGKRTSYDEQINALSGILESLQGRTGVIDMQNYSKENGEVILKEQ
ncbi:MAG: cell division protein FtsQ/DivIB [Lachnospiraceae bacterium]|nr:cell division protein FtsQ/DivIB [Lachnospiraceae bacterium]